MFTRSCLQIKFATQIELEMETFTLDVMVKHDAQVISSPVLSGEYFGTHVACHFKPRTFSQKAGNTCLFSLLLSTFVLFPDGPNVTLVPTSSP